LYFIILALLAVGAYFLVIKKPWGTLKVDETAFAVTDTSNIGKIFIADMEAKKIVLERTKDGWMVNQKYQVRNDYIEKLLSTIKNVTVNYPVAGSAQSTVVKEMASNNKKIEIYDRSGRLIKSYYVGNPSLDQLGTYMMMEGAEKPYVTVIPGFQGTLDTRYSTDESQVRSGVIYNYRVNQLKSVSVSYSSKPDSSFMIEVIGPDSFQLKNNSGQVLAKYNKQKIHQYLDYYKFVNCEAFMNDLPKKDSILQTQPICTITVTDRSNQAHTTVIYNMPRTSDSAMQYDRQGNPLPYDSDHFFATINNGNDFVIVQEFHMGRLFKKIAYFIAPSKPGSR
jgi:hypothetical protein